MRSCSPLRPSATLTDSEKQHQELLAAIANKNNYVPGASSDA